MSDLRLRGPNEFLIDAYNHMLGGKAPKSEEDWARIVNYWAANIKKEDVVEAVDSLCKYHQVPLSKGYIKRIITYQMRKR